MTLIMHNKIVINTGPIVALVAGLGSLDVLGKLYDEVYVTKEVAIELMIDGLDRFAAKEFEEAEFLIRIEKSLIISPLLRNMLDTGEASVIQYALDNQLPLVCIDESAGRRIARLNELKLTGSIGIILKAKSKGYITEIKPILNRMLKHGIFISSKLINLALKEANE
jgi:predicted nucleic acid-binding protein